MSYMHIENLYKAQEILLFKECYAMEKIHGTSAHILWNNGQLKFFSGGADHQAFLSLFDASALEKRFLDMALIEKQVFVYGEAYGGKMQGMSKTYGSSLKFVAFEVKIGDSWLNVERACYFVTSLGLEFVHYERIPTTLEAIDAQRDAFSVQAVRNGMGNDHPREGIVLRPTIEVRLNSGARVIAKHKREEFGETKTPRDVTDPSKLQILRDAKAIADEWATPERLKHVLDAAQLSLDVKNIGAAIKAMQEDIVREASWEIEPSSEARREIGTATALLIKKLLQQNLVEKTI